MITARSRGLADRASTGPYRIWTETDASDKGIFATLSVPKDAAQIAENYDLTISQPSADLQSFGMFGRWLAQAATERGISCALIHDGIVEAAIERLEAGKLNVGFHLDYFALWHVDGDPYARLALAVQDSGGQTVNSASRAKTFTDKANMHAELQRRRLGVPDTVLIRPWLQKRAFHKHEQKRLRLGEAENGIYVKPANGFGGKGILRIPCGNSDSLAEAIRTARTRDPNDTLLIQREVKSPMLVCDGGIERPAYWRVLYCLGEYAPFWWCRREPGDCRPSYRKLTKAEIDRHQLQPVLSYAAELTEITGLDWFSTELCLSEGSEPSRHHVQGQDGRSRPVVAIDYVNDQCDVDVQSRWHGAPPDAVVRHFAERFAAAAWKRKHVTAGPANHGLSYYVSE